jgi:hypothetical protein
LDRQSLSNAKTDSGENLDGCVWLFQQIQHDLDELCGCDMSADAADHLTVRGQLPTWQQCFEVINDLVNLTNEVQAGSSANP